MKCVSDCNAEIVVRLPKAKKIVVEVLNHENQPVASVEGSAKLLTHKWHISSVSLYVSNGILSIWAIAGLFANQPLRKTFCIEHGELVPLHTSCWYEKIKQQSEGNMFI